MKVKLSNIDPNAINSWPGVAYVRDTRWGAVVQAWPRKGARPLTFQEWWWRQQFRIAGMMAANAYAVDIASAINSVVDSQLVPRDWLTKAIYGTAFTIVEEDGTEWTVVSKGPPEWPGTLTLEKYRSSVKTSAR